MKRKLLLSLLFLLLFVPSVVRADHMELAIESSIDSVNVGDTFEVDLLSFNSSCDGYINTTLNYDSSVLELVRDDISEHAINKNVESNVNGSYSVIYEYNACDLNEGIPIITTYGFKVKAGNVSTTAITIDSYDTPKTINVSIEKSNVVDDNQVNSNINDKVNTNQNNNVFDNNDFMNYAIVVLLSVIALLLVMLICVMISRNKKLNRQ